MKQLEKEIAERNKQSMMKRYQFVINLAERILQMGDAEITNEMITTIEEIDIPTHDFIKKEEKRTIGFAC